MTRHDWISHSEAAEIVAQTAYRDDDNPRAAKNKAYGRIRTAIEKAQLAFDYDDGKRGFNREAFLQWAVKKWPQLRDSHSVPQLIIPPTGRLSLSGSRHRVDLTPGDPVELLEELRKCRDKIDEQNDEIERLRVIESMWNTHNDKKRRKSEQGRKFGKTGGRGNEL